MVEIAYKNSNILFGKNNEIKNVSCLFCLLTLHVKLWWHFSDFTVSFCGFVCLFFNIKKPNFSFKGA